MEIIIPLITAIISGGSAAIAAIIVAAIQHRKTVAILEYRLGQLEEKVDKHNNLVERIYVLEKDSAVIRNDIKAVSQRLNHLEKTEKKEG